MIEKKVNLQKEITNYIDVQNFALKLLRKDKRNNVEAEIAHRIELKETGSMTWEYAKKQDLARYMIKDTLDQLDAEERKERVKNAKSEREIRSIISNFDEAFTITKQLLKEGKATCERLAGIIRINGRLYSTIDRSERNRAQIEYPRAAQDLLAYTEAYMERQKEIKEKQDAAQAAHLQHVKDVLSVDYKCYYDIHDQKQFINFVLSGIWRAFCINGENFNTLYKCERFINENKHNQRIITGILVELCFINISDVASVEREGVEGWNDAELYGAKNDTFGTEPTFPSITALELLKIIHTAWIKGVPRLFSPFSWDSALYMTLQQQKNLLKFLLENEM
jgi:hypothetical protein